MGKIDLYIRTWSLIRLFYFLETEQNSSSMKKYTEILNRWNMGADKFEISCFENEFLNRSNDSIINEIDTYSQELKKHFENTSLTILFNDLRDIVLIDSEVGEWEKKALDVLKENWQEKLLNESEITLSSLAEGKEPSNSLVALGFLLLSAMKIDGHIDVSEVERLRENLSVWNNENARVILAAVNHAESSFLTGDILKLFDDSDLISHELETKIDSCLKFLKENEYVGLRRIMYEQVMSIILSDSLIHENERWLSSKIKQVWNDLED